MLLSTACMTKTEAATEPADTAQANPVAEVVQPTPVPADEPDGQDTAQAEAGTLIHTPAYGEEMWLEADENGFSGAVSYPSGFEEMDLALTKWANQTIKDYETKAAGETPDAEEMRGQLYVTYNAYELNNRYVGVKEVGVYTSSASGAQEGLVHTVNYDSLNQSSLPRRM